jgi:hypothetical protein
MRYLLFLLSLPVFAQTVFDPSQIRPCSTTADCIMVSVKGSVSWAVADPATLRIEKDPNNPWGWRVVAISPAVDALSARVSALESQQPSADVFVSTAIGQTFAPSVPPKWGYLVVVRNGIVQSAGSDYNFANGTVTFLGGVPLPNEVIRLQYWK